MKQEEKELLLADLCARLPYGVKVRYSSYEKFITCTLHAINPVYDIVDLWSENACFNPVDTSKIKPYLLPLSSMTEEQWNNIRSGNLTNFTFESFTCGCFTLASYTCENDLHGLLEFINSLLKNHFDVYGLIPKGLAIDATNLNIYG